jgi:putative ABC transport system permease protein
MSWFSILFRLKSRENQLDSELRFHLEEQVRANIRQGMDPIEARREAALEFGGIEQIKEECRDQRRGIWLENAFQDLRYGAKSLIRSPGFTIVALITLALGIGVNATMFSILNTIYLTAPPFRDPEQLVTVFYSTQQSPFWPLSPANFADIRKQNTVFEELAAFYGSEASLGETGKPAELVRALSVTANFFPMLGIRPARGRFFTPDEDTDLHGDIVVITNGFWKRRLAGDPEAIGRRIRLDGSPATVIGILPPSFDDPLVWGRTEIWRALGLGAKGWQVRNSAFLSGLGRLKPNTTLERARAQMNTIAARLAHDFPADNAQSTISVFLNEQTRHNPAAERMSWLTQGLTFFVLLIACVNLANLQLARGISRSREYAIRLALGSSRRRLLLLGLMESLLLSLAGGALGLLVAHWGNVAIGGRIDVNGVTGVDLPLNWKVVGFLFTVAAITGALFGIIPALKAARTDANAALKPGGRGIMANRRQQRLRTALVASELVLALALLTGAGFFVEGTWRLVHLDLGWDPKNILTGTLHLPYSRQYDNLHCREFAERLQQKLAVLPGVNRAVISAGPLPWGVSGGGDFGIEGRNPPLRINEEMAAFNDVTPGFFTATGMHLVHGRDFSAGDLPNSPRVVIINEAMAKRFWPGENPVGHRIGSSDPAHPDWKLVVGVVNDVRNPGDLVHAVTGFRIYSALGQTASHRLSFVLSSASDPRALGEAARRAVAQMDPDVAVFGLETAEEKIRVLTENYSLVGSILTAMALLGLLLASIGVYGVTANLTAQRTQEIGIRMALGAQSRSILCLILKAGAAPTMLGIVAGAAISFALTRTLCAVVPEVPGQSPLVICGGAVILACVALLASWLPARKATKVNPLLALRAE